MIALPISDLHLESGDLVITNLDGFDTVFLTGDIGRHTHGLKWAIESFPGKRVVYVPGNHEFLDAEIFGILNQLRKMAEEARSEGHDVHVLNNDLLILEDVRILGCTLWTDFSYFGPATTADAMNIAENSRSGMPDHQRIRCAPNTYFSAARAAAFHAESRAFLRKHLMMPFDGKTVVLTHHLPSEKSVHTRFKQSALTAAFASHLDKLVEMSDFWFHGHTHETLDYQGNERNRTICNPRGYPMNKFGARENVNFSLEKLIKIN